MELFEEFDEYGPEKILEVYDPETGMHAFTVIDNTNRGPGKGGIRMTPSVTKEEVFRLARTMTWKNALAGLPFGGAKSGIIVPREIIKNKEKKKKIVEAFARALKPLSPKQYIAAPDVNMAEEDIRWYVAANGSHKSATGKPANLCAKPGQKCGIPHEYGSTGFGVAHATMVALKHLNLLVNETTVAIEGFGNVGTYAAQDLYKASAKVVAVSDSKGCIYNPDGIDVARLKIVKEKTGSVINYKPGKVIPGKKLFELPVDVIIPAALPDVINEANYNKVRAKIIIEAANIPMTPEIELKLHKRGILVIPDFVANAGGVISSYAEHRGLNPKDMFKIVEKKIIKSTKIVLERAKKGNKFPREVALKIAVERVRRKKKK